MTKVFISPLLLEYRQEIAEMTNRCIRNQHIAGIRTFLADDPVLVYDDLLPPPSIEVIDLTTYEGRVHDMINILAFDDFGIATVRVHIQDETGEPVESGHARQWLECPEIWNYRTTATAPSGATGLVSVIATNRLGAVSVRSEDLTIP